MMKKQEVRVFGLTKNEIQRLTEIAQNRYGKASVSLLAKNLLQQQIRQPEPIFPENNIENKRLTLRLPPKQYAYLTQKAQLQHSSLNEIVRDILTEYITENPVLTNDEVQALYQSNYQLLSIGRNINQIAKNLNSFMPESLTTQQLNALYAIIEKHTEKVGNILRKQSRKMRYRAIRGIINETVKSPNR